MTTTKPTRQALEKLYADARLETEKFRGEAIDMKAENERLGKGINEADERRRRAENELGQLRERVDDLKERLNASNEENHHMRGYLDRVYEDDLVREATVKVRLPDGTKTHQPKRPPRAMLSTGPRVFEARGGYGDANTSRQRLPHWSRY